MSEASPERPAAASTGNSSEVFTDRLNAELSRVRRTPAGPNAPGSGARTPHANTARLSREERAGGTIPGTHRRYETEDHPPNLRIVRQGEWLHTIAEDHGYRDPQKIWNHPQNAELRKERRDNPRVLFPGDRLYLPPLDDHSESGNTEMRHRFQLKAPREKLKLILRNVGGEPLAGMAYVLRFGGSGSSAEAEPERAAAPKASASTAENGSGAAQAQAGKPKLDPNRPLFPPKPQPSSAPARTAEGEIVYSGTTGSDGRIEHEIPAGRRRAVLEYDGQRQTIEIGHLDPVEYITGVEGRLASLGYHVGPVDGRYGRKTESAVRAFQRDHGREPTGICDAATRALLEDVHRDRAHAPPAADDEPAPRPKSSSPDPAAPPPPQPAEAPKAK